MQNHEYHDMILTAYLDLDIGDYVVCPMESLLKTFYTNKQLEKFHSDSEEDFETCDVFCEDEEWYFFKVIKINKKSVVLKHLGTFNTAGGELNAPIIKMEKTEKKFVGDKIPYVELIETKFLGEIGILSQALDFILNKE